MSYTRLHDRGGNFDERIFYVYKVVRGDETQLSLTDNLSYPTSYDYFNGYYKMDKEKCRTLELSTGGKGGRKEKEIKRYT